MGLSRVQLPLRSLLDGLDGLIDRTLQELQAAAHNHLGVPVALTLLVKFLPLISFRIRPGVVATSKRHGVKGNDQHASRQLRILPSEARRHQRRTTDDCSRLGPRIRRSLARKPE